MYSRDDLKKRLLQTLAEMQLKYTLNDFPSGASMIDIWRGDNLYVIQLEKESIGFSMIDDEPAFTSIPDKSFFNETEFWLFFDSIFLR